ncbi:MAG TPA: alpha-1,4-glucan--maltose-1-phosphate maltosyltransferase [Dehalococcoidia bacterium]|nr:alpha-1,4-glucan--maltose-1-phosphate maltosyltransferase [Dehalococcoidia bacterium]
MSDPTQLPSQPRRVVIENVTPEVDRGRYAVKRIAGDVLRVEADVFADGHGLIACHLYYKRDEAAEWLSVAMEEQIDLRWRGEFELDEPGTYVYRLEAWLDHFASWRRDLEKRIAAGQDVALELRGGALMLREAAAAAPEDAAKNLRQRADVLEGGDWAINVRTALALDAELTSLMQRYAPREPLTAYDCGQRVVAERERARFGAWYELFPRSTSPIRGKHGSFETTIDWLPYVSQMGFDVLYLPPVHPIGHTNRKGPNNTPQSGPNDLGSPWAIGDETGGHKALHPDLGTLDDFRRLIQAARGQDMEVAMDFALQCSPDHPYVTEHPQWFKHRPDGTIRYAENPPKRYEDIYPIDFDTDDWQTLWQELLGVVCFWAGEGVRIFRVDNPHTKPFAFWEWLIANVKQTYPDTIFLAEAFTKPQTMYQLAKLGFTQSYTYFTWRNQKWDLTQYFEELTQGEPKEFFRPNLWPNTPDILHEYLQTGGRPAFVARLILAATLSAAYGIYGPPFELCVADPREPGSEEYLHSEKYELRHWDVTAEQSLKDVIARVNRARREHPALQRNDTLRFLELPNDNLIAYMKTSADDEDIVIIVVNLDPRNTQSGHVRVPLSQLGLPYDTPYVVHDLLDDAHYTWTNEWNYVELNPRVMPAHILHLRRSPLRDGIV